MKKTFLIFLLFFITVYSQTAYDFLRLDNGARAAALGGSFCTNIDDASSMAYNPASTAFHKKTSLSFGYLKHLLDVNSGSLNFTPFIKGIGRVGIGVNYINYGTFDQKDEFGNLEGTFGVNQLAFTGNYSMRIDEFFTYGANLKLIYSSISSVNSFAFAFDFGLLYYDIINQVGVGFSLLNIGKQIKNYYNIQESLPFEMRLGISKKLAHMPVRFSLDFTKLNANENSFFDKFKYFAIGAEFFISDNIILRVGYNSERKQDLKIGSSAGLAGFSGGLGIFISDYRFDYALSSFGKIGELHRFNLNIYL